MGGYAWMLPSPGAHLPGVLGPVVGTDLRPVLKQVDLVAERYGWGPVSPLLLEGDAEEHLGHLWLGFFATSLAVAGRLDAAGVRRDVLVGHSGGEVTALVVAGCFSVEDGARVLAERHRAVASAGLSAGGMVVLKAPVRRVSALCDAVDGGSLVVAVDNGPRQVVVSGEAAAIALLEKASAALDIETVRLRIPDSYHNPRLAAAGRRLSDTLADLVVRAPLSVVYSPQLGRYVESVADVRELLERILVLPVRFRQALHTLYADGMDTFVECGAKDILSAVVPECLPAAARAVPMLTSRAGAARFDDLITSLITDEPAVAAPAPPASAPAQVSATPSPAPPAENGLPDEDTLRAEIRGVYAEALQYPVEVIEDDVALEAELGVSSLKQTQVMVALLDRYGLPTPPPDVRVTSYRTVADVARLLRELDAA